MPNIYAILASGGRRVGTAVATNQRQALREFWRRARLPRNSRGFTARYVARAAQLTRGLPVPVSMVRDADGRTAEGLVLILENDARVMFVAPADDDTSLNEGIVAQAHRPDFLAGEMVPALFAGAPVRVRLAPPCFASTSHGGGWCPNAAPHPSHPRGPAAEWARRSRVTELLREIEALPAVARQRAPR